MWRRPEPLSRSISASRLRAVVALVLAPWLLASACGEPCCDVDAYPVPLVNGPRGELLVRVETPAGVGLALVDPGTPVSFWNVAGIAPNVVRRDVRLLGPARADGHSPLRARFHDAQMIEASLGVLSDGSIDGTPLAPAAIVGADLLAQFSVEFGFAAPELTFWPRQAANDGFLGEAGYAVLRVPRRGGGRLDLLGPRDWIGRRAPVEVAPSRLLLRACAAPSAFRREDPLPLQCPAGDQYLPPNKTGSDLSLLLATGVGPIVLGRTAWERISRALSGAPTLEQRPLYLASSPTPIPATWTSIPRLALIDREADLADDPGPCAELGRSRRTEQVELRQSLNQDLPEAACAFPCDRSSPDKVFAQNSAAYLELEGALEVAVVEDTTPFLQALRAEVRPAGPEVDGVIGARALAGTQLEIDYVSSDLRVIFSCEPAPSPPVTNPQVAPSTPAPFTATAASLGRCRAVGRCPRLPDCSQRHICFGLPSHAMPKSCDNDHSPCKD